MDYYQKYLKYKTKYLELKKTIGGNPDKECIDLHAVTECNESKCVRKKEHNTRYNDTCRQKHCIGRSYFGCHKGCTWDKAKSVCLPNCEKYNQQDFINKEYYCNAVKECEWKEENCQIKK